ncbi:MAG TPA: hypothetical protein VFV50_08870 [Bdellovibrionales bacterium]|nr:hypothetical protein [Bdellovibrionales bacterium]
MEFLFKALNTPDGIFVWDRNWTPDKKHDIRVQLTAELDKRGWRSPKDELEDSPPYSPKFSISISHSPAGGGFAVVPKPYQVGLDLEDEKRLTEKITARVCQEGEMNDAPDWRHLFTAKEAVFKALWEREQPATIAQIRIFDWAPVKGGYLFKAQTPAKNTTPHSSPIPNGMGLAMTQYGIRFAIFSVNFGPESADR